VSTGISNELTMSAEEMVKLHSSRLCCAGRVSQLKSLAVN